MIRILPLEDSYNAEWDNYVRQSPEGTFYHLTKWKKLIENAFRIKPRYLMALNESNKIKGVLPLFLTKDIVGRKYLISNPFSSYAGVSAEEIEIKNKLFDKAKILAGDDRVQYLEIRQLAEKAYSLPTKKDFVTMFLKLESDEESIWKKSLTAKARNQVRKAVKEGLEVDFGKQYLDEFYNVLSINIRDLGSPNYPKSFLKSILDEFGDSAGLIVVKNKNKVIGGMLFLCYKKVFSDPWASSLRAYNKLCPNDMLYWEAIKFACKRGCEHFDFGRSTINSGTFKFKKKWGAEPVQLYYQYILNKAHRIPEINASNSKYQAAINLWKKIPISISNTIGPRLIKYLPEL